MDRCDASERSHSRPRRGVCTWRRGWRRLLDQVEVLEQDRAVGSDRQRMLLARHRDTGIVRRRRPFGSGADQIVPFGYRASNEWRGVSEPPIHLHLSMGVRCRPDRSRGLRLSRDYPCLRCEPQPHGTTLIVRPGVRSGFDRSDELGRVSNAVTAATRSAVSTQPSARSPLSTALARLRCLPAAVRPRWSGSPTSKSKPPGT